MGLIQADLSVVLLTFMTGLGIMVAYNERFPLKGETE